jgi:CBS domain containing-hemolysin-like protein
MVKLLLLLIILILVNAFLAASEVSVVSLNKNRLRELAEDGDRKAQRLLKFAEEPNIRSRSELRWQDFWPVQLQRTDLQAD